MKQAALDVGIDVNFTESKLQTNSLYHEYDEPPPMFKPEVPSRLEHWVRTDGKLHTMANGRMRDDKMRFLRHRTQLEFLEGETSSARLAAKLANDGLAGTSWSYSYRTIHRSIWYFEVEFYKLNRPPQTDADDFEVEFYELNPPTQTDSDDAPPLRQPSSTSPPRWILAMMLFLLILDVAHRVLYTKAQQTQTIY